LLVALSSPHFGAPTHPSTPQSDVSQRACPTPYLFVVFTFRFVVESTKEFGGASTIAKRRKEKVRIFLHGIQ